jgi:hypothetical protein
VLVLPFPEVRTAGELGELVLPDQDTSEIEDALG